MSPFLPSSRSGHLFLSPVPLKLTLMYLDNEQPDGEEDPDLGGQWRGERPRHPGCRGEQVTPPPAPGNLRAKDNFSLLFSLSFSFYLSLSFCLFASLSVETVPVNGWVIPSVLVTFWLLRNHNRHPQVKGGEADAGSRFSPWRASSKTAMSQQKCVAQETCSSHGVGEERGERAAG